MSRYRPQARSSDIFADRLYEHSFAPLGNAVVGCAQRLPLHDISLDRIHDSLSSTKAISVVRPVLAASPSDVRKTELGTDVVKIRSKVRPHQTRNVLDQHGLGSTESDRFQKCREQISLVGATFMNTPQRKGLARNASGKQVNIGRQCSEVELCNIGLKDLVPGPCGTDFGICAQGLASVCIPLHEGGMFESSRFEAQR